jgi:hypothetical protein
MVKALKPSSRFLLVENMMFHASAFALLLPIPAEQIVIVKKAGALSPFPERLAASAIHRGEPA